MQLIWLLVASVVCVCLLCLFQLSGRSVGSQRVSSLFALVVSVFFLSVSTLRTECLKPARLFAVCLNDVFVCFGMFHLSGQGV